MVKRGSTTLSATKVAKAGLVGSAALQKIMDLEKEVSKLRHHVSVLSKRDHMLQKEAEKGKKEVEVAVSEVASPRRVEEPEPQMVAEPLEKMSRVIVAEEEEDVWVAPVAKPVVAESRVAQVVDEEGGPSEVSRPMSDFKRRRLDSGGEESEEEVEEIRSVSVVPTGPRGRAPLGPRGMMSRGRGGAPRVLDNLFVPRAYRFVDWLLLGMRNGMVGDSYQTRGSFARAPFVGRGRGFGGRGNRPCR